ncbi:MAG: ATP-binding protein [Sphingopyxis sp.]|uniref:AlbA family DNA-binding domain-containing protein n=1 Tax=Bosea sp. (in: a-proteobacteria) TaxID=1871050 RepID=UPI0012044340|nr:ATP-binding protein [Bosea sp. (in: a-proteobacteria)]MBJ7441480.1 ATP-binding protein [Sphingopyxis sp.]MDI1295135.1 ATP-binding protein [bacterium]TAJ33967.1 MAG: ATP-binding protein [Bosea sp. (in: a-proteobacteria)]
MAIPPRDDLLLQDLVEQRLETPSVEYKTWMSLLENEAKAKIARHLCALANSGGGHLVFGFDDDGTPSEPHPADLSGYSQDLLNGIVGSYLQPAFHVAVHAVTATTGRVYPVVRVPSHGAQPVCAKRDGPQDAKGRTVGIRAGMHYIREQGPKSIAIDSPERWRDVLHRCVLAERDALLGSIGRLFQQPREDTTPSALAPFVDDTLSEWANVEASQWPVNPALNRAAFGFRLLASNGGEPKPLNVRTLQERVRSASDRASEEVNDGLAAYGSGWRMDRRPTVAVFGNVEGYVCRAAAVDASDLPSIWRVTAEGMGADVTILPEDAAYLRHSVEGRSSRRWPAGAKLSPRFHIQSVAQRVAFVRNLAASFPDATDCELLIDYSGLKDRKVEEPAVGRQFSRNYVSAVPARRFATTVPVEQLVADPHGTTVALLGPVFRLFDGWDVNPEYVRAELARSR